jgi:hypothetical protein
MPQTQRGQAYKLNSGKWGLRYYDADGARRRKSPFPSKSAALSHYRDVIEPQLRGEAPAMPQLTLAEFVPIYLERHSASVRGRTKRQPGFDRRNGQHLNGETSTAPRGTSTCGAP